jgi:hypothetical protein
MDSKLHCLHRGCSRVNNYCRTIRHDQDSHTECKFRAEGFGYCGCEGSTEGRGADSFLQGFDTESKCRLTFADGEFILIRCRIDHGCWAEACL